MNGVFGKWRVSRDVILLRSRPSHLLFIFARPAHGWISEWFLFHQNEQKDGILWGTDENIFPNKLVCGCFLRWPMWTPHKFQTHLFLRVRGGFFVFVFFVWFFFFILFYHISGYFCFLWLLKYFTFSLLLPLKLNNNFVFCKDVSLLIIKLFIS